MGNFPGVCRSLALVVAMTTMLPTCAFAVWQQDGNPVCTAGQSQSSPQVTPDGAGGAIIAWRDMRAGTGNANIYAQRVDSSGVMMWTMDGVAICTADNDQNYVQIVLDGAGGAIITWQDKRNGVDYNIYAQRVDANGVAKWAADGVTICSASNDQYFPRIIPCEAGGAIITWTDNRDGSARTYARRVNANGAALWGANGVAVCTSNGEQYDPQIATDGAAGAIITWEGFPASGHLIYAQHVSVTGALLWGAGGVKVCTSTFWGVYNPRIASDGSGGAIVTWQNWEQYMPDYYWYYLYAQRLDENGSRVWGNPVGVWTFWGMGSSLNISSEINTDGAGGAIIGACGDGGIDLQRIDASGTLLWPYLVVPPSSPYIWYFGLTADGAAGAIVTWQEYRGGNYNIYAQRINASGTLLWTTGGVAVCAAAGNQGEPQLASDGSSGAVIAWSDSRDVANSDIYAQRITALGSMPLPPDTTPPQVTAVRPNGGEVFFVGSQDTIRWIATDNVGVTSVSIYYSTNGGSTFPYTIATGESNDSTYVWTVPSTLSDSCKVKVVAYDAALNDGGDISDDAFTIMAQPAVPDLSPLGVLVLVIAVGVASAFLVVRKSRVWNG